MPFEYIWGLLESEEGSAPTSEMFSTSENGCKFYPFAHKGRIFTFDKRIWNDKDAHNKAIKGTRTNIWPDIKTIEEIILDASQNFSFRMIAFSDTKLSPTIEKGKTVEIHELTPHLRKDFLESFVDFGYDIVDVSGLSALTDVGYNSEELQLFSDVQINKYGLVAHVEEAAKLSNIASKVAPEHAYFFPVNLWGSVLDASKNP